MSLSRQDLALGTARYLARILDPARFDSFGCSVRGLHTVDHERDQCRRCALSAGLLHPTPSGAYRFEDDRGLPYGSWGQSAQPWTHVRWLDRHGRLGRADRDRPALIAPDLKVWATGGRVRRGGGLPAIYRDPEHWAHTNDRGLLHRDNAPAVSWGEEAQFWNEGRLHRRQGAAVFAPGKYAEYWRDGQQLDRDEAWAHWAHDEAGVALDNADAQQHLHDLLVTSERPEDPFPALDAMPVTVALRLYPNID
ncbi:hypothetical protein ACNI3K_08845 [Demequina sp. SO4-13]|uniref:hypothetical protein n=1 Tax=Demequina sp. SO4-13 TaxID=3401027 RepID=UPI003AF54C17